MTEIPKLGALTPIEKIRLDQLREELIFSNGENVGSLPPISSDTIGKLKLRFNIDNCMEIGSREGNSYYRAQKVAQKYADYFSGTEEDTGTKKMFNGVQDWLKEEFPPFTHDAASIGFFLVLDAFCTQFGEEFIKSLGKIEPARMKEAIDVQKVLVKNRTSLIDRSAHRNRIPEYEIFLREFIDGFVDFEAGPCGPQVESGACLGFKVMEALWPELKLGNGLQKP